MGSATPKQRKLLRKLCTEHGMHYVEPDSIEQAATWISALLEDGDKPTENQLAALVRITNQKGLKYVEPKTKREASFMLSKLLPKKPDRDVATYRKTTLPPGKPPGRR